MSGWDLPPAEVAQPSATAADPDWVLPEDPAPPAELRTGPSGLLLGSHRDEPVVLRLFRPEPTRVFLAAPSYVSWLLAFRCVSIGAHLSVISGEPRRWNGLVRAVHASGGSADLLAPNQQPPGGGRPYRPSVVIDDSAHYDGFEARLGAWQTALVISDAADPSAVFGMRSCELALVAPCGQRIQEHLRRAYALTNSQLRPVQSLAENEVALAMPRRLMKLSMPPAPGEYQTLFAG